MKGVRKPYQLNQKSGPMKDKKRKARSTKKAELKKKGYE